MNVAVPTKQVQTGGGYWDNTSHTTSQSITFSGTYSRETIDTGSRPIYVQLNRGTKSASYSRSYKGTGSENVSFLFQCPDYVSGGTISGSINSSKFYGQVTRSNVNSNGYCSGTFSVKPVRPDFYDKQWEFSIVCDYTALGDTWTGSGSIVVSGHGVASASTSSEYVSLNYTDGGSTISASVSIPADEYSSNMYTVVISPVYIYNGYSSASDSGTLPFSPDRMSYVAGTSTTICPSLSIFPSL